MVKVKSLKVCFIHPDLGIGGAERLILDVAVALADQGMQVVFVTNHFDKSHAFEELKSEKYPVRVVGDWLPRSIFGSFQALCAYIRMLYLALVYYLFLRHEDSPDIYFVDQIPMAIPFIKWTGCKVIYYCHHPDLLASPEGGVLKRLYRKPIDYIEMYGTGKADVILVNSHYTSSVFYKTFPQIVKNVQILYPTISAAFQQDIEKVVKKPMHLIAPEIQVEKPTDVVFLSINRYHPAKQLQLAINAMAILATKVSLDDWIRIHLIIAGGYDPKSQVNAAYFQKLIDLTHAQRLIVKIVFLKSPSDLLKAELLKACDCLLYTPTNEHFGIVPLEAMAASKPVIACNSGGPRETVEHDVTGYLCEPNEHSLAFYMSKMLNKKHAKSMGEKGLLRLEKMFSYNTFAEKANEIVTNLYVNTH